MDLALLQKTHAAPRGLVGEAHMSDLSRSDQFLQGFQHLMDVVLPAIQDMGVVAPLSKVVGVPLRPMQLEEVDMIGAQTPQTALHGLDQGLLCKTVVADVLSVMSLAGNLGGQD